MEEFLYLVLSKNIEKKRKIDMISDLAGYFNSISRRMVSDSSRPNRVLSSFESTNFLKA